MSSTSVPSFKHATPICLALAIATLVAMVAVMRDNLLPEIRAETVAPAAIWTIATLVMVIGIGRAAWETLRFRREWRALGQLGTSSAAARRDFPGTVVAARVAAVDEAIHDRRVEREFRQSNRTMAAARLAGFGTLNRFASSALLVLAVLGTFAGMRGALPPLVDGITATVSATQSGSGALGEQSMRSALTTVAEAFGSNFVALFGSLVLGLVAFGAGLERRSLLTHLEHLSERLLYRQLPADADASELQKALQQMERSVSEVAQIGHAVGKLGAGIGELREVLNGTLREMHDKFSDSMQRESVRMQQQLNDTVGQLVATLGTTTSALQATAVSYEGLVRGLEERDLGVRSAADALRDHADQLADVQKRVAAASTDAARATESAAEALTRIEALAGGAVTRLVDGAERVSDAIDAQQAQMERLETSIQGMTEQQGTVIDSVTRGAGELRATIGTAADSVRDAVTAGVSEMRIAVAHGTASVTSAVETHAAAAQAGVQRMGDMLAANHRDGIGSVTSQLASAVSQLSDQQHAGVYRIESRVGVAFDRLGASVHEVGAAVERDAAATRHLSGEIATMHKALDGRASNIVDAIEQSTRVVRDGMAEDRQAIHEELQAQRRTLVTMLTTVRHAVETHDAGRTSRDGAAPILAERRTVLDALRDTLGRRTDPSGHPTVTAEPPPANGNGMTRPGSGS